MTFENKIKLENKLKKRIGKRVMTNDVIKAGIITNANIETDLDGNYKVFYLIAFDDKTVRYTPEEKVVLLKEVNK